MTTIFQFCKCLSFVDDVKMFNVVSSLDDASTIQTDLDRFYEWCLRNSTDLSIKKSSEPLIYPCCPSNCIISSIAEVKDLRLNFSCTSDFSSHIFEIVNSVSKTLGFVIRFPCDFHSIHTIKLLRITHVRSLLEYASMIRSPKSSTEYSINFYHLRT